MGVFGSLNRETYETVHLSTTHHDSNKPTEINILLMHAFVWNSFNGNLIKRMNSFLLYGSYFVNMFSFCYLKVNSNQEVLTLPVAATGFVLFAILQAGIRNFFLLLLGIPLFAYMRIFRALLCDVGVWIVALLVAGANTYHDNFQDLQTSMIALEMLLITVFINTTANFEKYFYNLIIGSEKIPDVPYASIIQVVQESNIKLNQKMQLLQQIDIVNRDQNESINRRQFVRFLYSIVPLMLQWEDLLQNQEEEESLKDLKDQLQFNSVAQKAYPSSEDFEVDDQEEIMPVVISAFKLLVVEQHGLVFIYCLCLLLACFARPFMDLVAGNGLNSAQNIKDGEDGAWPDLRSDLILFGVLYLLNEVSYYFLVFLSSKLITNGTVRIQRDITHAVLYSKNDFEQRYRHGSLQNLFNAGVTKLQLIWNYVLFDFAYSVSSIFASLVILSSIDVGYAIFSSTVIPFMVSMRTIERKSVGTSSQSDSANGRLFSGFRNLLHVRSAVNVGNSQKFVLDKIKYSYLKPAKSALFYCWFWGSMVMYSYSVATYTFIFLTTILLLMQLANMEISIGEIFSLLVIINSIAQSIENYARFLSEIANLSGPVYKFQKVLDDANNYKERLLHRRRNTVVSLEKELILNKVAFSYPKKPLVLKGLSAVLPSKTYNAIVGRSGSGKSTLLKLFTGILHPDSGDIKFDGVSLTSFSLCKLRDSLGVVFQETYVFDGTIRDNIAFGYHASEEDIVQAAKDTGIHEFIMSLPDQYDTLLGKESKVDLSGGQLQRICGIARALARKPKLLVLDEATSFLDTISQRQIIETIERLRDNGLTILSVTHRISTTVNADLILVLDDGIFVERGRYDELMSIGESGYFWRLANADHGLNSEIGQSENESISYEDVKNDDSASLISDDSSVSF